MAPDSMRRSLTLSGHGVANTFPAHFDGHELLLSWCFVASPTLAVGEVLALAAAPGGIGEEVLGLDGKRHLADQLGDPRQFRNRAGSLEPFESGSNGFEEHVEPEPWDGAREDQAGQCIGGKLQVPLQATALERPTSRLEI